MERTLPVANRLAGEASPYLLQHADNPVDWYPWGDEAFERARADDRPVLLSIGYAACHWCHVMEHESFEDDSIARLMNEKFVNVKVDREERPDVDALYMDAVVALTGHGGWPMTVFLTPEGAPFYGGTYFPPEPRHGLPSFPQLLEAVSKAYRENRADVTRQARALVDGVRADVAPSADPLTESLLHDAARNLRSVFDPVNGGFGARVFAPRASPRRRRRAADGREDARRHGRGRHVRPRRRRLPPIRRRRALARAALREDAVRQRAPRGDLPARLGRHPRRALSRGRGRNARVRPPRARAAGGRVRVVAGRGHRRRRRAHLHVDRRRGRSGG